MKKLDYPKLAPWAAFALAIVGALTALRRGLRKRAGAQTAEAVS